jgi:hypothetical protein
MRTRAVAALWSVADMESQDSELYIYQVPNGKDGAHGRLKRQDGVGGGSEDVEARPDFVRWQSMERR